MGEARGRPTGFTPASRYDQALDAGPEQIAQAVDRLRSGGLVAFPTETVYGLGADAMNAAAVRRVFTLKQRPMNNPLIVHVSGAEMARKVAAEWPWEADRLASALWPGPLTLVLPKAAAVPPEVTAGGGTVAVRCPDHPLTLALIEALGGPIVGPSANPSGRVSPTTAEHVKSWAQELGEDELMVLDGGPCRGGIESTVVLLSGLERRVLRPGLVSAAELSRVLGREVREPDPRRDTGEALLSPGMMAQHYAPRSPAVVYSADQWPEVMDRLMDEDGEVVVITHEPRMVPGGHVRIGMPADARGYASRLYSALREADDLSPAWIAVEAPPRGGEEGPIWAAVRDRLSRATKPFE